MKANEDYRNDPVLRAAVRKLIEKELFTMQVSLPYLRKLYRHSTSLDSTKIWSLIDRSNWYIKFYTNVLEGEDNGTSAYVGNMAAFLTEYDAERMRAGIEYDKLP
jgi:hypothetical protein